MVSQLRFNWHNLDFNVRVTHTRNAGQVIEMHQILVLEARWLDTGAWIERDNLELILRFVHEQWDFTVRRALIHHLTENPTENP